MIVFGEKKVGLCDKAADQEILAVHQGSAVVQVERLDSVVARDFALLKVDWRSDFSFLGEISWVYLHLLSAIVF
jgi:hypothetical protein